MVGVMSTDLKGTKTSALNSKGTATSSKVNSNRGSEGLQCLHQVNL